MPQRDSGRAEIPEDMKRSVRQRCGFGCVICGNPIGYHYDHMVDYAEDPTHLEDNLTLLCPNHHGDKTAGRLSRSQVQAANREPFNTRSLNTSRQILHTSDVTSLVLGSNSAQLGNGGAAVSALTIDEVGVLQVRRAGDRFELDLDLRARSGEKILTIQANELVHSTGVWDSSWQGNTMRLRSAPRKVLLRLALKLPKEIVVEAGRFSANGVEVLARPNSVRLSDGSNIASGWSSTCVDALFALGDTTAKSASVRIADPPRTAFDPVDIDDWFKGINGET